MAPCAGAIFLSSEILTSASMFSCSRENHPGIPNHGVEIAGNVRRGRVAHKFRPARIQLAQGCEHRDGWSEAAHGNPLVPAGVVKAARDRKSTRLNSSHLVISY